MPQLVHWPNDGAETLFESIGETEIVSRFLCYAVKDSAHVMSITARRNPVCEG
jgi:hypothetical protein